VAIQQASAGQRSIRLVRMRAFEIHINGNRACLAGVSDEGVLTAIISWTPKDPPTERLEVGGLESLSRRHLDWGTFALHVGDEVKIKILDVEPSDPPTSFRDQ
jgi:hypothetical protein